MINCLTSLFSKLKYMCVFDIDRGMKNLPLQFSNYNLLAVHDFLVVFYKVNYELELRVNLFFTFQSVHLAITAEFQHSSFLFTNITSQVNPTRKLRHIFEFRFEETVSLLTGS